MISDKKIFKIFYIGKIGPTPSSHVFLTNNDCLNKATFLPSNIEISHVVSDKKNSKVFYTDIDEK